MDKIMTKILKNYLFIIKNEKCEESKKGVQTMIIAIIIFLLYFLIPAIFKVFIFPNYPYYSQKMGSFNYRNYIYKLSELDRIKWRNDLPRKCQELKREVNSW